MENWYRSIFLVSSIILGSQAVYAEDAEEPLTAEDTPLLEPKVERRQIEEAAIDDESFAISAFVGYMSVEDFGTNLVYGARAHFFATEDIYFEGAYGLTTTEETSFEKLNGNVQLLTDDQRDLTYYYAAIGYNLLPGEGFAFDRWAFNTAFNISVGAGSTKFAADSRFTVNYGIGYRFIATDWIMLQTDFRTHMFEIDLLGENKTSTNLEWTTSLGFFF